MGLAIPPEKQYFKIREVSDILDLEPYVLRYWESEFKLLKPTRTRTQQRLYHRQDLELLVEIKNLLYNEKFSVAGTKKRLQMMKKQVLADKKAGKITKNINSNQEPEPTVVETDDDVGFQNCIDYRKLLFYIKTELQSLRLSLE
jgi:DNA-binding transcriptional MerR regulator